MPSQSRGYWSCDYCGMEGFDTYDDANAHEIEDCPHRKRQPEPARHEAVYPGPQPIVPYAQQQHQMMDAPQPETADYQDDPRYQIPQQPYYPRRIPLLIPGTQTDLSVTDSATCSSIEVMESTPDIVNAANVRRTERTMVSPGQVVLRCIQCVRNPASAQSTPQLFPNSISSMASTVRSLQDHLRVCAMVHDDVKRAIGPSVAKGRRALEDDERDRLALIDYCTNFCRREGLFNKHPPNSGIVFSEMETETFWNPAYGHPDQGMSPQFAPHYPTPQRPGPPSAGPMANDPMSTPMGSRRGRPFQADRSDAYPPPPQPSYSGGYPYSSSPYTPQYGGPPHPERAPYSERSYGTEAGQARYEQGPEYPPHPMETSESSQPPGYLQPYEMPPDFPFVQEPGGSWECKYCSHIHPQYRDPQSIWSAPGGSPPPVAFIDQHLSMCRTYHTPAPPTGYSGPPSPYPFMPIHPQSSYPYGWDVPGQPPGPPTEPHEHHTPARAVMPAPPQPQTPYSQHPPPATPHSRELARRRSSGPPPSGPPPRAPGPIVGPEATAADREMERAKVFLTASVKDFYGGPLVLEEDKLLLTDYFFYLMKQLKLCRFSELDRKTRGGKRDKIRIGYGGLQCVHCSDTPNGRKFYWSNVDRLANSFAEIPGHLFKCRRCPQPLKDALLKLKGRHAEQMARLPRGSQKVFFRRMWRRLHDEDPPPAEGEDITPAKSESDLFSPSTQGTKRSAEDEGVGWSDDAFDDTPKRGGEYSSKATPASAVSTRTPSLQRKQPPAVATTSESVGIAISAAAADTEISPATSGSESVVIVERTSQEAAKALASSDLEHPAPPSPSSRVLLAIPEDKEWLSDMDCFMRRQVEVFCASSEDVLAARSDRKHPVALGQIGIRCLHCALSKPRFGARGTAVAFPYAISGIFECVRELGRTHMESCENMPKSVKDRLISFKGSSSLTSVLRKYYLLAAKALGLYDTTEGIRAGAESVPLGSQAAFAFSPETSDLSEQLRLERGAADAQALESSESKPSATMGTPSRQSSSPGAQSPREKKEDETEPASPKQTGEPV